MAASAVPTRGQTGRDKDELKPKPRGVKDSSSRWSPRNSSHTPPVATESPSPNPLITIFTASLIPSHPISSHPITITTPITTNPINLPPPPNRLPLHLRPLNPHPNPANHPPQPHNPQLNRLLPGLQNPLLHPHNRQASPLLDLRPGHRLPVQPARLLRPPRPRQPRRFPRRQGRQHLARCLWRGTGPQDLPRGEGHWPGQATHE